jgi:hypothetical protein
MQHISKWLNRPASTTIQEEIKAKWKEEGGRTGKQQLKFAIVK